MTVTLFEGGLTFPAAVLGFVLAHRVQVSVMWRIRAEPEPEPERSSGCSIHCRAPASCR